MSSLSALRTKTFMLISTKEAFLKYSKPHIYQVQLQFNLNPSVAWGMPHGPHLLICEWFVSQVINQEVHESNLKEKSISDVVQVMQILKIPHTPHNLRELLHIILMVMYTILYNINIKPI